MTSVKNFLNNLRLPARASLWYIGTSFLTKAMGFLITPIFTHTLTEEEYGLFTLYISVLGAVSILISAFTSGSAIYMGFNKHKNNITNYYYSLTLCVFGISSIICILLLAFSPFLRIDYLFCFFVFIQLLLDSVTGIYLSSLRFSYSYKKVAAICIFEAVSAPIIAILLINLGLNGALSRIFSLLLVSFISAAYSFTQLFDKLGRFQLEIIKYTLCESLPLLPHTASSAITAGIDKFVITAILGTASLAKYSVVHSVGVGLTFVVSAAGASLTPWILRHSGKDDEGRVSEVLNLIFRLFSMLTLFLLAVIPYAVKFLAPPEYSEALGAAFPIALSTLPAFLISVSVVGITHSEKSRYSVWVALTAALLNIFLNFMLVPHLGYMGAGTAQLISQSAGAFLAIFYLKKCNKNYFLNTKELGFTSLVTFLLGGLISLCYSMPALRILLLIIPAIITLNSLFYAKKFVLEI